ncbi:MAG: L-tyrosine/L-tryptophan isonitrile synthase family protein [Pseudomonadota bacterium]|nr:L-tyrosine/L-tryptophan isonitrile synthase family protein [Pseudomonadota bacterium]
MKHVNSELGEYNSDSAGGTHDQLLALHPFIVSRAFCSHQSLTIGSSEAESIIKSLFKDFDARLAELISIEAVKRFVIPGRWNQPDRAAILAEVLTCKKTRKGGLTDAGRYQRRKLIFDKSINGLIEFAILLLPARPRSPIKYPSHLPDLGEVYTLCFLSALSKAVDRAQRVIQGFIEDALAASDVTLEEIFSEIKTEADKKKAIMDEARKLASHGFCSQSNRATLMKIIKRVVANQNLPMHLSVEKCAKLLFELAKNNIDLDIARKFSSTKFISVKIFGIQDSRRYPCFDYIPRTEVDNYRCLLLKYLSILNISDVNFELLSHEDLERLASRGSRYSSGSYYGIRINELHSVIEKNLDLLSCSTSRDEFHEILGKIPAGSQLSSLFEPVMYSSNWYGFDEISSIMPGKNGGVDYINSCRYIYTPRASFKEEVARKAAIKNILIDSSKYISAYEANTESKNPEGYDDVRDLLPNALRMSIHKKDESIGHFSINISPSYGRTPWHGCAALRQGDEKFDVKLSIEMALRLDFEDFLALIVRDESSNDESSLTNGLVLCHVDSRLSSELGLKKAEDIVSIFSRLKIST